MYEHLSMALQYSKCLAIKSLSLLLRNSSHNMKYCLVTARQLLSLSLSHTHTHMHTCMNTHTHTHTHNFTGQFVTVLYSRHHIFQSILMDIYFSVDPSQHSLQSANLQVVTLDQCFHFIQRQGFELLLPDNILKMPRTETVCCCPQDVTTMALSKDLDPQAVCAVQLFLKELTASFPHPWHQEIKVTQSIVIQCAPLHSHKVMPPLCHLNTKFLFSLHVYLS